MGVSVRTEPTRGDVRGNENWNSSASETLEDVVSLALALVSVNSSCFPSQSFHLVGELVSTTFCFCEDDSFGFAFFHKMADQFHQLLVLFILIANVDNLKNSLVTCEFSRANSSVNVVVSEEIVGKGLNFLEPSSTVHKKLPVWSNLVDNLSDLRLKSHVQHSVCLIENQICASFQICFSSFEEVKKSSGSGDDDFNSLFEVADLWSFRSTTKHAGGVDVRTLDEILRDLLNLLRQLSSWQKDDGNWTVSSSDRLLSADVKHRGKQKGKCFARASSGDTDHIEPREADREADRLDGRWLGELAPLDAFQNVGREVALFKLEDRARALVVALFNDADFFFLRPVANGRAASVGDVLVLSVEILLEWHKIHSFPVGASQARSGVGELSSSATEASTVSAAATKAA